MKQIFNICLLLASVAALQAQNSFNAFAGVNYSYFTDGIAGQILAEESFGLHIGASYEVALSEKISFRPAVVFDQVGDRTKTKSDPSSKQIDQLDLKLSYLNIPMDFKFWNKIYVFGGPQIGFLISKDSNSIDPNVISSSVDMGFNLGTGFTVNKLFFEIGLYQGLTTLRTNEFDPNATRWEIHNGYARFMVGYKIL